MAKLAPSGAFDGRRNFLSAGVGGVSKFQWARLQADVDYKLRRGAWYRVLRLTALEAVVDVHGKPVTVPRPFLEIVRTPPRRWTVVSRPPGTGQRAAGRHTMYAVCPSCRHRMPVRRRPAAMRCQRCKDVFEVAWDESYHPAV